MTAVRISSTNNRVAIVAEDRSDVEVHGEAHVDGGDGTAGDVTIERVRSSLKVRVPIGTDVIAGTTSGRLEARGELGSVSVVTESGRIQIEGAESVDARTTSARIEVDRVSGNCRIRSGSGRVRVGACRSADVATTNGRIDLPEVDGPVRSHCISGRIEIGLVGAHDVDAETVSGRVSISVPPDIRIHRPGVDGGPTEDEADCTVEARSVSGRVDVAPR